MNEWPPSARRALDAWLERQRPRFTAGGVDADELTADLRAHVEAELAGKNLAVVLENQRQYDQAGLRPADPTTVAAVPEPGTWALFALGMAVLLMARGSVFRRQERG